MKVLKRLLMVVAVFAVLVLVALGGAVWWLDRYVQKPEFKQLVLSMARQTLHTDVQMESLHVSLFTGIELRGIAVANPAGFDGNFVTAQAFVMHYRLLPLLRGRVEVGNVTLELPTITLAKNAQGEWNYTKFGAAASPGKTTGGTASTAGQASRFSAIISKVGIKRANITMIGDNKKELLRATEAGCDAALDLTGTSLTGTGQLYVGGIVVPNVFAVRDLTGPVALAKDEVRLTPLKGKVGGGDFTGKVLLRIGDPFRYETDFQITNADLTQLFQETAVRTLENVSTPSVTGPVKFGATDFGEVLEKASSYIQFGGKLQLSAALAGGSGLESMVGTGRAEVVEGTLSRLPLQELIATVLMVPELSEIKFQECRLEFSVSNNVLQTPVIHMNAPGMEVTGKGSMTMTDFALNHDFTLALSTNLLARVPAELRSTFADRGDGFVAIDFRVWGPYSKPKTDLTKRVVKGAAKEFLKKLFKRDDQ